MTVGGEAAGRVTEDLVFECLQRSRRQGDVVWRNQRLTSDAGNSEVDFLLGLPGSGFIALEVKGGKVTVEGEGWYQQSRGGYRKRINPMTQARQGMYGIRDYVEADPRWVGRGHARWGHAVVLPFSEVADDFAMPDCPRHMIFGRDDLVDLVPRLAAIADRQQRDREATAEDVLLVRDILLGRGHPQTDVIDDVADLETFADYLTQQQRSILDVTRSLARVEVRGGPGSGKTFLALEQVRRLAQQGKRVALVCVSQGLAASLIRTTGGWPRRQRPAFVGTYDGLVRDSGGPRESMRYDAIVVDEAQDLPEAGWPGLTAALRSPETGYLMIMNDDRQHPFPKVGRMPGSEVVLVLEHNIRNARLVADAFEPLSHARAGPPTAPGPATRFVHCSAGDAGSVAEGVIERLLQSRWAPRDIAVLTTGEPHPEHAARRRFGEAAYWNTFLDGDQVFYGHVLDFSGLERPVVVLVVNEEEGKDGPRERLYVGMSRARDALVVCGDTRFLESVGGPRMVRDLVQANLADRHDVGEMVGESVT